MFIATRQIPPESAAQQPSTLRAEIEREKETVNEKREKVLEAASEMMKKSKFDGVSGSDRTPGYEGGAFDGSIKNIKGFDFKTRSAPKFSEEGRRDTF